jgi:hypothetical protein
MPENDPGWWVYPPVSVITKLRLIFGFFVLSVTLAGVLIAANLGFDQPESRWLWAAGGYGVFGVWAVHASSVRPLVCGGTPLLVAQYRTRFFVAMAFGETPFLVGAVVAVIASSAIPAMIGLVASLAGFAIAAPARRDVAAVEQHLHGRGCPFSLVAGLYEEFTT